MTYDKLTDKLREAEICVNEGNSDKAEYLAKEVLKELSFDGNIITGMQDALVLPADNQRQRLDFIRIHARSMHLLGTIEWRRGEYSPALEHCTAALAA
ncbi:MAG: hypothetical protein JST20_02470, partial [Bacteroidetes bacterium]|nr:hypothetical protein [Bacteroidota bacterium]